MSTAFKLPTVEANSTVEERFVQFLRSQSKRLTSQKRIILQVVRSYHEHFDAEELLERLQEFIDRGELSRSTVYRMLCELVEAGILRRMQVQPNGRRLYEHDYAYPRHDHLLCEVCNRLIEFHADELDSVVRQASKVHRFNVHDHRMVIAGVCHECGAMGKTSHS